MDLEILKNAFTAYNDYVDLCLMQNMDGGDIFKFPLYAGLYFGIPEKDALEYFINVVP